MEIVNLNPESVWAVPKKFQDIYSHAAKVSNATTVIFISGQFGVRPDGSLPGSFEDQALQAMKNIEAILAEADMNLSNLAKLNFFITDKGDAPDLAQLRSSRWGGFQAPAVTVLTVSALARPEYRIEIEAIAAK